MKVLHVAPYTDVAYGGPGVAIRTMAEVMTRAGAEVHVVTTNAAGNLDLHVEDGGVHEENGISFRYFRRAFPRFWFRAPGMVRWLKEHARDYDLLHLHVPFTAPFRAGAQSALAAERPYLVTPHGVLDPWSMRQKAWKKRPYFHLIERMLLSQASALHVTAPLEAEFIEKLSLGPKVKCVPLSVPSLDETMLRHRETACPRILCIARLHPVKALEILFGALARVRSQGVAAVLDLAGDGDAAYVDHLKRRAVALGIENAVIWHGHVDNAEKCKLYASASCFALLSYHENFGLAAAEALAAGVPVLVSDQVGLAPDVHSYQAGRVVPVGDIVRAADALLGLIEPDATRWYRIRANQLAQEQYSDTKFAIGLAELYSSVLFCRDA